MITLRAQFPSDIDPYARILIATELAGQLDFEITDTEVIVTNVRHSTAESYYKLFWEMGLQDIEEEIQTESPPATHFDGDAIEDG